MENKILENLGLSIKGGTSLDARLGSARTSYFCRAFPGSKLEARNSISSKSSARLELEKTADEYPIITDLNF